VLQGTTFLSKHVFDSPPSQPQLHPPRRRRRPLLNHPLDLISNLWGPPPPRPRGPPLALKRPWTWDSPTGILSTALSATIQEKVAQGILSLRQAQQVRQNREVLNEVRDEYLRMGQRFSLHWRGWAGLGAYGIGVRHCI
jgi:hypothetical protein